MIVQTYYISTGAKNAMYTLRLCRDVVGGKNRGFLRDYYICNLAADESLAITKARKYFEAVKDRIQESDDFKLVFADSPDNVIFKRRGKLSVQETRWMAKLEQGILPFGAHKDKQLTEMTDQYVLFWADQGREQLKPVMEALSAFCMGIALDRDLIAKRDVIRAERHEVDSKSNFIGTLKERRSFTGELFMAFEKKNDDGSSFWINKVRLGDDIVSYMGGKALGKAGEVITFKATIIAHDEYNGVRSTKVNRPV